MKKIIAIIFALNLVGTVGVQAADKNAALTAQQKEAIAKINEAKAKLTAPFKKTASLPQGSYKTSCKNCSIEGDTLTCDCSNGGVRYLDYSENCARGCCTCEGKVPTYQSTSIKLTPSCSSFKNNNGNLGCE